MKRRSSPEGERIKRRGRKATPAKGPAQSRRNTPMQRLNFIGTTTFFSVLATAIQSASAATKSGSSALALASLVAVHSPVSNTSDTLLTRRLFNGHFHQLRGDTKMISVMADAIVCSVGIVDITAYSCKLIFGAKTVNLTGRAAHELYATMAEAGVQSQSTANALSEGLSHLMCTINPLDIAKRSGDGADCKFDVGM
jgi:hypothetical protein